MGRLSCTWRVCARFCDAKQKLLQCLSGVFAALNGCVCGASSAQNGRVCGFRVDSAVSWRSFLLVKQAFFVYFCGIKRVCLWTLLRGKTDAFAMSFGRVCGVKRVCLRRFFSAKRTCLRRVCGFRVDSAVSWRSFLLVKWGVFRVLGVFVDAFATQNGRFCNVFRACLRR